MPEPLPDYRSRTLRPSSYAPDLSTEERQTTSSVPALNRVATHPSRSQSPDLVPQQSGATGTGLCSQCSLSPPTTFIMNVDAEICPITIQRSPKIRLQIERDMKYWLTRDGARQGPYSAAELTRMVTRGSAGLSDLVWVEMSLVVASLADPACNGWRVQRRQRWIIGDRLLPLVHSVKWLPADQWPLPPRLHWSECWRYQSLRWEPSGSSGCSSRRTSPNVSTVKTGPLFRYLLECSFSPRQRCSLYRRT